MSDVDIVVRVLVDGKQKNLSPAVATAQNLTGIVYIGHGKWFQTLQAGQVAAGPVRRLHEH
jgi:hypothetical protein